MAERAQASSEPKPILEKRRPVATGPQTVKEGGDETSLLRKGRVPETIKIPPTGRNTVQTMAAEENAPANSQNERQTDATMPVADLSDSTQANGFPWVGLVEIILLLSTGFCMFMVLKNRKR